MIVAYIKHHNEIPLKLSFTDDYIFVQGFIRSYMRRIEKLKTTTVVWIENTETNTVNCIKNGIPVETDIKEFAWIKLSC